MTSRSTLLSLLVALCGCGTSGNVSTPTAHSISSNTTAASTGANTSSAESGTSSGTSSAATTTHGSSTSGAHTTAASTSGHTSASSTEATSSGATSGTTSGATSGSACTPTLPTVAWTSPYAGWANGISSDPSFFPLSVWLQGSWHASEMASLGVNIYLGNNAGTDPVAQSDITILQGDNLFALIGQDATGLADLPTSTIVGWWMTPDEPDNAQPVSGGGYGPPVDPSALVTQYATYQTTDPTRPIFLGLGQGVAYPNYEGRGSNPPAESGYVPAADILDFDIYPYNNCGGDANDQVTCGQFWLNAQGVDSLHQWSTRNQAVWTDIETTIINAGTTAGPTPKQTVSETWLSLIHGANGITYFIDTWNPTFREDGIFQDGGQAMVAAVTALNAQIEQLAPELNSADLPNVVAVSASNSVDTAVKANGSDLYIFSAIADAGIASAAFTVNGMSGNGVATVIGESRTLDIAAGKFSDDFAENDVHLYEIDLSTVTCN